MSSWIPRIFNTDSTPLTELLASPTKQGILHALLGGAHVRGASDQGRCAERKGMSSWIPRIFNTDSTPLTELLASPTKQGILHALLGGAHVRGASDQGRS